MIEVVDADAARQALAAGRLDCPSCGGMLRPWGRTRDRAVAGPQGTATVRLDRPDAARAGSRTSCCPPA